MMRKLVRVIGLVFLTICCAGIVYAGGVDPRDQPTPQPVIRENVKATPAQTAEAVRKARQAVAPPPAPVRNVQPKSQSVPVKQASGWLLGTREAGCTSLANLPPQVREIGGANTPQELARKMRQRGHQSFILDLTGGREMVVRVKIPDLDLDLTFSRSDLCR